MDLIPTGELAVRNRSFPTPRTNAMLSAVIELAIKMMRRRDRHYAEALLRMYACQTPIIMRVLFDPAHRRKALGRRARA